MEQQERKTAQFVIDGDMYDVPQITSLNMDESVLFYEYAKVSPLDFEEMTPPALAAFMHIAIQRKNPAMRDKSIRALIGKVNMLELMTELVAAMDDAQDKEVEEERPPASATTSGDERLLVVDETETEKRPSSETNGRATSDLSLAKPPPASTGALG